MKRILFIFVVLIQSISFGQIDQSQMIIGRNTGTKTLHDGAETRIFGFAELLNAPIDIPGPTLIFNEGDSIEIDFFNVSQGAPHTIHLHGLDVNQENDGVPALSFEVHHMDHGYYKFKAPHPGTYIYHCHVVSTIHVQAGMYGVIIIRPANGDEYTTWTGGENYDREFLWTATEIDTNWHTDAVLEHDTLMPVMIPSIFDPQYFFVNGQSGTQLTDITNFYTAAVNDKVYMRLVNIGYYGVRYIFPSSISARTISSDGRPLPTEVLNDTVEVLPGERYGTIIQLGTDPLYPVIVEHFNLNTQEVESSQNVTIRTSQTGINENIIGQTFMVYPNPSSELFFTNGGFTEQFEVFDLVGNLILSSDASYINLSHQPSGTYLVRYKGMHCRIVKD